LLLDLTPVIKGHKLSIAAAVKARAEVRSKFAALTLDRKQALVRALCCITVAPATKGIRQTRDSARTRVQITSLAEDAA
jgi:hypothetical protein